MNGGPVNVSLLSAKSLYMQALCLGSAIGEATGFVVQCGNRKQLITNRHVVRGRHNQTDDFLHPGGLVPDALMVLYPASDSLGAWEYRSEPLYTRNGMPRWKEHPDHGGAVDVVALDASGLDQGVTAYPYDPSSPGQAMMIRVGVDLFVIGFPFGRSGVGGFAVWVRGSIATDPDLNYSDLPSFLIDARTRPGASGSPVVAYSHGGGTVMEDGSTAFFPGSVERLVGVYSGRIHPDADLGVVWKLTALKDIVERGVPGSA